MRACDNPFSVERIEKISYRPLKYSFDELFNRLKEMNYRAAIVGPDGSGKTTLLENFQTYLDKKGQATKSIFINDTSPLRRRTRKSLLAELNGGEIVLLDGADLIHRLVWPSFKQSVLKKARGLIITSHRLNLLPTLIECSTTECLLQEIVTELLAADKINYNLLSQIYNENNGNIRTSLRQLYDLYAHGQHFLVETQ